MQYFPVIVKRNQNKNSQQTSVSESNFEPQALFRP